MNCKSPIGIFDSGLGGLTVVKQVCGRLPAESTIYIGDQIHIPYGERDPQEIRYFALSITDFLVRSGAKMVIMACNMSDATALDSAREAFPNVPIIGVIRAGTRAAARAASGGRIGVLATTGTVRSGAYGRELRAVDPSLQVYEQACPRFVPLVEAGMTETPEAEDAAREYVQPLLDRGCDTLILGCTHYPFLAGMIAGVAGRGVRIIDPAEETAIQAAETLAEAGVLNPSTIEPARTYYTTGCPEAFADLGGRLLGMQMGEVNTLEWGSELGATAWQETTAAQTTKSGR